jgi:thymidylate synthase
METIASIRRGFEWLSLQNQYTIDKTGTKVLELIGESFIADEETIFGEVSPEYIKKELEWYYGQSLRLMKDPPLVWKSVAGNDGKVNSNYGWCIFSHGNMLQYEAAILQLLDFKESRRSVMIYTRPSMQTDYRKDGMNDFMCTNTTQMLIRNDRLWYIVNQRSMDAVYGYKNDRAWHIHVQKRAIGDLSQTYPNLQQGPLIFQTGSLHLYEKHFHFIYDGGREDD